MGKIDVFNSIMEKSRPVTKRNVCPGCFGKGYNTVDKEKMECTRCKGNGFYETIHYEMPKFKR